MNTLIASSKFAHLGKQVAWANRGTSAGSWQCTLAPAEQREGAAKQGTTAPCHCPLFLGTFILKELQAPDPTHWTAMHPSESLL